MFFLKIIKIITKGNTSQTVSSFDQKTCFDQKPKLLTCFLNKTPLKEKAAEPDQIKLAILQKKDQNFIERPIQVKTYCL